MSISQQIVTLSIIGYLPASGTLATLITLPFILGMNALSYTNLWWLALVLFCSFCVLKSSIKWFERHDPREIVIDEVIGCCIAFYTVAPSFKNIFVGCLIFRLLDIFKPSFIGWCERLPGIWGIMLDDICAGICTNILLVYVL